MALFLLAVQGSFAVGALIWGGVAEQTSLQIALVSAGLTMAVSSVLVLPLRLSRYMDVDTDTLLADPPTVTSVHDDDGPILLTSPAGRSTSPTRMTSWPRWSQYGGC